MRKGLTVMAGILWILAIAGLASNEDAAKSNFSGVWNLTLQKSKLQIPAPDSGVFNIDHKESLSTLTRRVISSSNKGNPSFIKVTIAPFDSHPSNGRLRPTLAY